MTTTIELTEQDIKILATGLDAFAKSQQDTVEVCKQLIPVREKLDEAMRALAEGPLPRKEDDDDSI